MQIIDNFKKKLFKKKLKNERILFGQSSHLIFRRTTNHPIH